MSVGTAIFFAALLIAMVLLYGTTKDRWPWRTFGNRAAISLLSLIFLAILLAGGFYVWDNLPIGQQTQYAGLEIGLSPQEVMYRKGSPPTVYGEMSKDPEWKGWQQIIDVAKLEKGKTINDYDEWSYGIPDGRVDVTFNPEKTSVIAIQCFSNDRLGRCPTLAGVNDGDSEIQVLKKFGTPQSSKITGLTKTLAYSKIGVSFTLEKQQVYMMGVNDLKWAQKQGW